jgi:hypothetical protein
MGAILGRVCFVQTSWVLDVGCAGINYHSAARSSPLLWWVTTTANTVQRSLPLISTTASPKMKEKKHQTRRKGCPPTLWQQNKTFRPSCVGSGGETPQDSTRHCRGCRTCSLDSLSTPQTKLSRESRSISCVPIPLLSSFAYPGLPASPFLARPLHSPSDDSHQALHTPSHVHISIFWLLLFSFNSQTSLITPSNNNKTARKRLS